MPICFAILSAGTGWHVADLMRAIGAQGHVATMIDFRRVSAGLAPAEWSFAGSDLVVVRTMPPGTLEQVVFRMDVLHRLQAAGVPVVNPPRAIETCVDKYLASARLEGAGICVPPTRVVQSADAAQESFAALGNDVVVKPLFGSEGRGMMRITDPELAWRTFHALERIGSVIYLQRFIPHPGWDVRAFVLGGRVLAAMRRRNEASWRTNVAQGATAEPIRLQPEQERIAIRAAHAVGAEVAGVDLLPGPDGTWYVLEVNAVPGWRALRAVTQLDIASAVVEFVADCAQRR